MPIEKLRPSFTLDEERLAQLQAVVPEAFVDGQISWDVLREALGEHLEEEDQEHFGLSWPGKREARRLASQPSKGTLIPQPGQGVNEDETHNIFIEGDNLEVLKLLQKSYAGRIKLIYIDPPYNTGNDLIYVDDFREPLDSYLKQTHQSNETGQLLTSNTRVSGRFHSNWLNMIYPRLRLARNLLRDDGAIYVSIDDNEVHFLRATLDELFGEENFVGCIVRATGTTTGQDSNRFGKSFDYLLVYSKTQNFTLTGVPLSESDEARFSEEDEQGKYALLQLRKTGNADRREDRPSMYYPVIAPDETKVYPVGPGGYDSRWRFGPGTYQQHLEKNLIVWKQRNNERGLVWVPYVKYYLEGREKRPSPLWNDLDGNKKATIELKNIIGAKVFDNPKPTQMVRRILEIATNIDSNDIILDFFAGSGTTAHALVAQNLADGGNRRFICVQMAESTPPDSPARAAGFMTIDEICVARIKNYLLSIQGRNHSKTIDLGFKNYTLTNSNFRVWQNLKEPSLEQLQGLFDKFKDPLQSEWGREDLLAEILLIQGFPLDSRTRALPEFHHNHVLEVSSEFCHHRLYICLDEAIRAETAASLSLRTEDVFVCLDSALTDQAKIALADRCNLKVI